jgi:hypothetical protein
MGRMIIRPYHAFHLNPWPLESLNPILSFVCTQGHDAKLDPEGRNYHRRTINENSGQ